jgi:hypothetical protein
MRYAYGLDTCLKLVLKVPEQTMRLRITYRLRCISRLTLSIWLLTKSAVAIDQPTRGADVLM